MYTLKDGSCLVLCYSIGLHTRHQKANFVQETKCCSNWNSDSLRLPKKGNLPSAQRPVTRVCFYKNFRSSRCLFSLQNKSGHDNYTTTFSALTGPKVRSGFQLPLEQTQEPQHEAPGIRMIQPLDCFLQNTSCQDACFEHSYQMSAQNTHLVERSGRPLAGDVSFHRMFIISIRH